MFRATLGIYTLLLALMTGMSDAQAFQVDQSSGPVKDPNTSNLADPDDQAPPFMLAPQDESSQRQQDTSSSVTIDQNERREQFYGLSQGFDKAYSNK